MESDFQVRNISMTPVEVILGRLDGEINFGKSNV